MDEINSIGICNRLLGSAKQRIADLEFDLENVRLMLSVHLAAGVELRSQLDLATEALRTWLIEVSGDDEEERQVARQLLGLPKGWPHGYECDCCPRNSQASGGAELCRNCKGKGTALCLRCEKCHGTGIEPTQSDAGEKL